MSWSTPPLASAHGIPDGLPLALRPRHRRIVIPFVLLLTGCGFVPYGVFAAVLNTSLRGDTASVVTLNAILVTAGLLCLVLPVTLLGLLWWRLLAYGGTYLAAGPDGVWFRPRPWSRTALWLPWQAVDLIELRGRWIGESVTVHAGGRQFGVPLLAADRTGSEVLEGLAALAAGRCRITGRSQQLH